jgi:uncharacterized protein (TIGR03000 family)
MAMAPMIPPAKPEGTSMASAAKVPADKAKVVVEVPADARVYIDDTLMKTSSGRRVYETPTLDRDAMYFYHIRMEVVRGDKVHTETKKVTFKAGEEVKAVFGEPSGSAETESARR